MAARMELVATLCVRTEAMALPLLHALPVECLVMEGRITKRNVALVRLVLAVVSLAL